jgi:outer membrane protein assembly factor BamB
LPRERAHESRLLVAGGCPHALSCTLHPDEREAVRGDFAESGVTGREALRDLLTLVVRRQVALWRDWRPWLALLTLVIPLGLLVSLLSARSAGGTAVYAWMYANNWTWAILDTPGPRRDLFRYASRFLLEYLTLFCWSWTIGYVIGALSRRTTWLNGALFCLLLFAGTLVGRAAAHNAYNAEIFADATYRVVLPLLLRLGLVVLPALWGMRTSRRQTSLPVWYAVLWAVATVTLTMREAWMMQTTAIVSWYVLPAPLRGGWLARLLPLVIMWPVACMLATANWRRWRGTTVAGVLLLLFLLSGGWGTAIATLQAQRGPQDYTQWRGQNRDGAASAFVPPRAWPEQLTRRWKVDVGEGYATPLIVHRTVYVFTRRGGQSTGGPGAGAEAGAGESREGMLALDAETGKERWHTSYPAPYTPSRPAAAHGAGPKATPLFHEGKLFTLGVSGIVAAFDAANGKLLWRTPAPAEAPFFSAASSPVGDRGVVIVHPGNYGPLTAFDTNTGAVKWTAGGNGFFASPIIVSFGGVRQVVSATQKSVIGVSVADGALLWEYPWTGGGSGGPSPVLFDDTIIISALNMGVAAFKPVKRGDAWTADTVWETKDVWMYVSNPVTIGDTLFGLSHRSSGQFFALDARSGKTLWLGAPREAANTAIVKADDLLFLLNDDGELIVAKSSRTGFEPVKRYMVADSATWAQPAISGKRLFIRDASSLALWTVD